MIYPEDGFAENFSNASGSDPDGAREILVSAISDMVVADRKAVIRSLREAGISISDKAKNKELANQLAKGIFHNKNYVEILAKQLAKRQEKLKERGLGGDLDKLQGVAKAFDRQSAVEGFQNRNNFNAEGFQISDGFQNIAGADIFGAIKDALTGFTNIASSKNELEAEKERTQQALYAALAAKNADQNSGPSVGAIIGWSLAGAAVIGIGIFVIKKMKKKG